MKIYKWRDEPIEDIEQWAHDRNERMVDVTWKVRNVNPYAGKNAITYYEEQDTMPESFFQSLRMDERAVIKDWKYRTPKPEISEEDSKK